MPVVRRGTVHRLAGGSAGLYGVLVLTNDVWNRRMGTVGVVPIRPAAGPGSLWEPVFADQPVLQARVEFLAALPSSRLLEPRFVLPVDDLGRVADALGDLLALPGLCAVPPVPPSPVPGPTAYPRWGEIYYVGPPISGQVKRHLVVSRDEWNATTPSAVVVRTTSQPKRWGSAFPPIEGGAARACCGDATNLGRAHVDMVGRPSPPALDLADMARVARGVADVFELTG